MEKEIENYSFSQREMSRIEGFTHLVYTAAKEKKLIAGGQESVAQSSWKDKKGKKRSLTTFDIDNKLITIMGTIAFNMYCGNPKLGVPGLKDKPNTKWAADTALQLTNAEFGENDVYLAEAQEIWSRE